MIGILCGVVIIMVASMALEMKLLYDFSQSYVTSIQNDREQITKENDLKIALSTKPSEKKSLAYAMENVMSVARQEQGENFFSGIFEKKSSNFNHDRLISSATQTTVERTIDQIEYNESERKLIQLLSGSENSLKLQRILIGGHHAEEIKDINDLQQQYLIQFKADPDRAADEIIRAYDSLPPSEYPNERATLLFLASTLPQQERSVYSLATAALASTNSQALGTDGSAMIITAHAVLMRQNADPSASLNLTVDSAGHQADPLVRNMLISHFIDVHPELREQLKAELDRRGTVAEIP